MIIVHAAQLAGQLTLWAEDSDQPSQPDHAPDGRHPRCAEFQRLAKAVGVTLDKPAAAEMEATIWLPSRGNHPIPSEALAGPGPKSRAKPRIKPWRVPVIRLSAGQAIELLQRWQDGRVLTPGVALGRDVAYWRHVMLFAAGLTVRQQFLPSVIRHGDGTEAVWTPLYVGDDAHRLAELASAMPASARAMTTVSGDRPPTTPPQTVLREFIARLLNHMVRQDAKGGAREFDSAHDAWLQALTTSDGGIYTSVAQLQQLRRQVAEWHRPIAVAANSPYRLCLRLEEPPEPDEDDPPTALREQAWYLRYLLQPHDDHSLLLPANDAQERLSPDFNPAEFLLTSLAQAGSVCPPVSDSLNQRNPAGARLDAEQAHQFLTQ